MTDEANSAAAPFESERDRLTRALGMDPAHIAWLPASDGPAPPDQLALTPDPGLSNDEWQALVQTGLLPEEPSQAHALGNRQVLDAVLATAGRRKPWTSLPPDSPATAEAIRKKFSRLVASGLWQALAAIVDDVALTPAHRAQFKVLGRRASTLSLR